MAFGEQAFIIKKYKSFTETFTYCAFGLALGFLYPNKNNKVVRAKVIAFCIFMITNSLMLYWFTTYTFTCISERDFTNLTRHLSVSVVVFLFFFKSFYLNYKGGMFQKILDNMTKDLLMANNMDEKRHALYDSFIAKGKVAEKIWIAVPLGMTVIFPSCAAFTMSYRLFTDHPQPKVMIHEMEMKEIKDKQWSSPYFEIFFFATVSEIMVFAPNFTGFDGSFCIAVNHLCLKLKLVGLKLSEAFTNAKTEDELKERVKDAIRYHQESLLFHSLIQEVYGGWLLCAFLISSLSLSLNLYQISVNGGVDPKYLIFAICAVTHNLVPCYFCSQLFQVNADLCDDIYAMPWEVRSPSITNILTFMIAKTQQPLIITGKGLVIYNMELFVSVMQTSYSYYTIMRT